LFFDRRDGLQTIAHASRRLDAANHLGDATFNTLEQSIPAGAEPSRAPAA
jgi:hypothetical protein